VLKSLCAIVHGGDNAVPVKEKGLGEGCKEEIVRKVCKLGRDGVGVVSRMGGVETVTEVAGCDGVSLELMEVHIVLMEVCYIGVHVMMELPWEEATNSEVEEIEMFGSGSGRVQGVKKGSVHWQVVRGGSRAWWGAMCEDCGLEGILMGVGACRM